MPGPRSSGFDAAERGFTLLETLIALVILGAAVIGAVEAFGGGLRGQAGLERHRAAVVLADQRMAELELLSRDSLGAYRDEVTGPFAPPFSDYRWAARVRPAEGGGDELLEAVVRVSWAGGEYTLTTLFYRPDPLPRALRRAP